MKMSVSVKMMEFKWLDRNSNNFLVFKKHLPLDIDANSIM